MTKIVSFEELGADPDATADQLVVYAKEVDGVTQLYGRTSDGTIYQITPVKPTRVWSYPAVNGPITSGDPFLTISGFQQVLGKRYTFIASAAFNGSAGTAGEAIDLALILNQDSGKPAVTIVDSRAYWPSQAEDNDTGAVLAGQGSVIGDGNTHDYIMYAFWNEDATWSVIGYGGQAWLTIIETDNEQ